MKAGEKSFTFDNVYLLNTATVVGIKEYEGPLSKYMDKHYDKLDCDCKSFEKAEIQMFKDAIDILLLKANVNKEDIDLFVAGDLCNQIVISNYVLRDYDSSYLGVFSACATAVEGIIIASTLIDSNNKKLAITGSSSHNATAERQFRYPVEYGGKKAESLTSTATASGVGLISKERTKVKITKATIGSVKDANITDSSDLGRAMGIAAYDTIISHFKDFKIGFDEYDLIVTGDLSFYGKEFLLEMLKKEGIKLKNYEDSGLMLYDRNNQDVFAGGSGAGCIASVMYGYLYKKIIDGTYNKILIVATGALHNPIMLFQKETIPSIAHAIVLEREEL